MSSPKPLVQAACICEKVLVEADNVPSLIRVVDTYTLPLAPEEARSLGGDVPYGVNLTVFVSLKSGEVVGNFAVGLRLIGPDDMEQPVRQWPVELRGGEHGANLKIMFALQKPKLGLYWFDVLWDGEVLTRIPFRLTSASTTEPTELEGAPTERRTR